MSSTRQPAGARAGEHDITEAVVERTPVPAGARAAGEPGAGEQWEDRWRRAAAELDNSRKRYERQLAEQTRAERARTAAAFLPVLDNLELALRHAAADPAAIVPGVVAVHAQAVDVLSGLGLHRIDPVGQRFDPARHEASRVVPAGRSIAPGTVVEVHRPGFADADGTLVRPAVVTVARPEPDGELRPESDGEHRPETGEPVEGHQRRPDEERK